MAGKREYRATIPEAYRKEFGRRIRREIEAYTKRRTEEARKMGMRRPAQINTAHMELFDNYGIPPHIMEKYERGERTPNIVDLRSIARFLGKTVEYLMQDIPTLKEK